MIQLSFNSRFLISFVLFFLVNISIPGTLGIPQSSNLKQTLVARSTFQTDPLLGNTVSGIVNYYKTSNSDIIISGEFDTGFEDPNITKYAFAIQKDGDIKNSFSLDGLFQFKIFSAGTDHWTTGPIPNLSVDNEVNGKINIVGKTFYVRYQRTTIIGAAIIKKV
ncbi:hypothetical protein G9A89_002294 [Geosiphon pyriformis]|nr:hypothetical protein G9A89_002294 [Geosiphon pyriformis]